MNLPEGKWVEGGSEYLTACPKCGKLKLFYSPKKRVGYCQRCGHKMGKWDTFHVETVLDDEKTVVHSIRALMPAVESPDALNYLFRRRVDVTSMPAVLYSPAEKRLYFPLTAVEAGYPMQYHTRTVAEDGMGWKILDGTMKSCYVYNPNPFPDIFQERKQPKTILVEGIFDALAIGPGAICLLGAKCSTQQAAWLANLGLEDIRIWLDPDDAGREGRAQVAKELDLMTNADVYATSPCEKHEPSDCAMKECPELAAAKRWLRL